MKTEQIKELFAQFEAASSELEGIECWSARELQSLLGYSKWENFEKVIEKAKESCRNAGEQTPDHFPDVRKTITKRGIVPENLPPADDVKKLQRKLPHSQVPDKRLRHMKKSHFVVLKKRGSLLFISPNLCAKPSFV